MDSFHFLQEVKSEQSNSYSFFLEVKVNLKWLENEKCKYYILLTPPSFRPRYKSGSLREPFKNVLADFAR